MGDRVLRPAWPPRDETERALVLTRGVQGVFLVVDGFDTPEGPV